MTQENHRPRRTIRIEDPLWAEFAALHGDRKVSARVRTLMAQDIAHHRDHTFTLHDATTPDMQTAPEDGKPQGRSTQDNAGRG